MNLRSEITPLTSIATLAPAAARLGLLAAVLALAACGGGGDAPAASPAPAPSPTPSAPPPPAPAVGTAIAGRLYAAPGSQATLRNNAADDLLATIPAGTAAYDSAPFTFSRLQADGSAYAVTVATAPAGQTCQVYAGAAGTAPLASGTLRVGCEFTMDHIVRAGTGTGASVPLGTYFDSVTPVVGGANVPIGTGTTAWGEGRFVAFVSSAPLAGSTGARRQVFVRDRLLGTLTLISAGFGGAEGNGDSWEPQISADGRTVVFESSATNLVAGDTNGVKDVFMWQAATATVTRISVGSGGGQFSSASGMPSVSGDGRFVAFETINSNLTNNVAGSDNTTVVVKRDMASGALQRISQDAQGRAVDSYAPMLSEDGSRLAFYSFGSTLVAGDTNGLWDIFVHDAASGTLKRVSLTATGGERNQGSESASRLVRPAISGDGRWVAYTTTATNVVAGDTNNLQDVFVVDTQTGAVTRASVGSDGTQANGDSGITQGERPALSYDGSWVAFTSRATNLGAGNPSGVSNVYLHSRVTGETRVVTRQTVGSVGGPVGISRSAGYLTFGAAGSLDPRFAGSGLFAHYTGLSRAFAWPLN